jgi:hypothetical protein
MKKSSLLGAVCACLLSSGITTQVFASSILSPTSVINNTLGVWGGYSVETMIDQSGLITGFDSGVTDFDSYISSNPLHLSPSNSNTWASAYNATAGIVDFDLGSVFSVSDFAMWGDNGVGTTSAPKNFNLFSSVTPDFSSAVSLGSFIGAPSSNGDIPVQVFSFALTDARYIRFEIIDN